MDGSRFDELTRRLAAGSISRRGLLRGLGGASLAAVLGPRVAEAKGGNSACAHFCAAVFGADTPAAGQCTSQAAHGTGMCYACGPKGGGDQTLCGATCIPASSCCTNDDCPSGQCLTCDETHACVTTCGTNQHCDASGNCVADDPCAAVTCEECQACSGGACVAANDGDPCSTGTCSNGACVASDPCAGVTCPECQTCSNGVCVAANEGLGCSGGTCLGGTCSCAGNPACGACQICTPGGSCADVCTGGCTCPAHKVCDTQTGLCVSSNPGGGCFVAGTRVAMADGTSKPIELVEIGDRVIGHGGINRVLALHRPTLGDRPLYAVNGAKPFVTASHPFLTIDGWKAVDPAASQAEVPGLAVGRLTLGDRLLALAGVAAPVLTGGGGSVEATMRTEAVTLTRLVGYRDDPATRLYNLRVDGDHTYVANDLIVHNKIYARPAFEHLTTGGYHSLPAVRQAPLAGETTPGWVNRAARG